MIWSTVEIFDDDDDDKDNNDGRTIISEFHDHRTVYFKDTEELKKKTWYLNEAMMLINAICR